MIERKNTMARAGTPKSDREKKEHYKAGSGVLIRGADGGLYLITKKDLRPFKLPKKKAKQVKEILGDVELVVPKLPPDVVKRLQCFLICIALHYPDIKL
jgi:hypothetical protein